MIRRIEDKAEDRDGFRFRGGNVALDLTATLQRRLTATPSELLKKPNDLARWLVSSGLTETAPPVTDTHLESAKVLREAIFTLASAANCGALDPDAVSILNNIAEPPPSRPILKAAGEMEVDSSAAALLSSIAREAIYLFGRNCIRHLRQCESPTCTIFFHDKSRSQDRRWCSMAGCGNKAKVANHRSRQREARRTRER